MTSEGQQAGQQPAEATSGGHAEPFGPDGFSPDSDGTGRASVTFPTSYAPPPQSTPNGGSPFVVPTVFGQPAPDSRFGTPPPPEATSYGSARVSGAASVPPPADQPASGPSWPASPGSDTPPASAPPPVPPDRSAPDDPFGRMISNSRVPGDDGSREIAGFAPGSPTRGYVGDDAGDGSAAGRRPSSLGSAFSRSTVSPDQPDALRPPGVSVFGDQRVRVPGATLTDLPDAPPPGLPRRAEPEVPSPPRQTTGSGLPVRGASGTPNQFGTTPDSFAGFRPAREAPRSTFPRSEEPAEFGSAPVPPRPASLDQSAPAPTSADAADDDHPYARYSGGAAVAPFGSPVQPGPNDGQSPNGFAQRVPGASFASIGTPAPEPPSVFGPSLENPQIGGVPGSPPEASSYGSPPNGGGPGSQFGSGLADPQDEGSQFGSGLPNPQSDGSQFGSPPTSHQQPADQRFGGDPFGSSAPSGNPFGSSPVNGNPFDGSPFHGSPSSGNPFAGSPAADARAGSGAVPQPRDPSERPATGTARPATGAARPVTASASVPVASRVTPPPDADELPPPTAVPQARVYGRAAPAPAAPETEPDEHDMYTRPSPPPFTGRPVESPYPQRPDQNGPGGEPPAVAPQSPGRISGRATASARVTPPTADPEPVAQPKSASALFNEFTADVAGRGRPVPPPPPDQFTEHTTDISQRGHAPEQPYVPAPALPSMHSRPPLENGFPPPPQPGQGSRPTVTPPGPEGTTSWSAPGDGEQGRFDKFKQEAAAQAAAPATPHVRMLPVLVSVVIGAVLLVGLAIGVVWLIARGSDSGTAFSVNAGDCVKKSGDEAVKATCGDAGAFQVVSIADTKEQCADPGQPYVLNPTKNGKTQVLCLKPSN